MKRLATMTALAALSVPALSQAATWEIDPAHSSIGFAVKHMMVSTVRGEFGKFSGTVNLEPDLTRSSVEVTIDVASVDTRDAKRDGHLQSPDFFDAARFPTATFKSTSVEKTATGLKVVGKLTMKGVTKAVTLEVKGPSEEARSPFGSTVRGASATAVINRKDFGVSWNKTLDTGGMLVGEEVVLSLDVELVRKEAPGVAKK